MPSARELYEQQKRLEEQRAREARARGKAEEEVERRQKKAGREAQAAEERKQRDLETQRDRVAEDYLKQRVVGQLKDLKDATGGRISWDSQRGVSLAISSEVRVENRYGEGNSHNPKDKITYGVSVEVKFDDNNQGHLTVNDKEVRPSDLPQALANAALRPGILKIQNIVEHPHSGGTGRPPYT